MEQTNNQAVYTFPQIGEFRAMRLAEEWLAENGYSVGSPQRGSPRGILRGDVSIAKWRNLSPAEGDELDGTMTGDMRNGPVTVTLFAPIQTT